MPGYIPTHGSNPQRNSPSQASVRKAKVFLQKCGCLAEWENYTSLAVEGKNFEMIVRRLRFCILEHCWSIGDIDGVSLTIKDRSTPYPITVHNCLTNKLKNAKDIKKEALELVSETRRLLMDKHKLCRPQYMKHLLIALKVTSDKVREFGNLREIEIENEIRALISESGWQRQVNPNKVRNLTTNEINTTELEVLSLGLDFKLENGNNVLEDVAVAFQQFKYKYSSEATRPHIHFAKNHLISKISKDNTKVLPRRYSNAIKSLKSNKNIMVMQSDKGKQTVICYRTTYLTLTTNHFSNTDLYHPVEDTDFVGNDLDCMAQKFKDELTQIASQVSNRSLKKLILNLSPPKNPKFPTGRCKLKMHKSNVTKTFIPVRPIISNTNSPTSNLVFFT